MVVKKHYRDKKRYCQVATILLILVTQTLYALTPQEQGLEIVKEAKRRDQGFHDVVSDMEMILRNAHGQESRRFIRSKVLEQQDDGDKNLVIFKKPADVKGTALLSFTHKSGSDDQWLYLPALKRVKRIASRNKAGPFMGSEFAYEDMTSQEVEKYTYEYLRDEMYQGIMCFVVARYPVDKHSGYTKQISWIDKSRYIVLKTDFYDRKKSLLKTLTFKGYQQYLDKYWRPNEMFMKNHQTSKTTTLLWENYQFRIGLKERDFSKNSLKRAR